MITQNTMKDIQSCECEGEMMIFLQSDGRGDRICLFVIFSVWCRHAVQEGRGENRQEQL